jgi:AraC family ethanolamine operon transcriptional activator
MTPEVTAGRIPVSDIEELNFSVWPWDLRMRQLSRGKFRGVLDFAEVNGIFLTHERWSHRVAAVGATPAGYLALAGSCSENAFSFTGQEIDSRTIVCELDAADIEFSTPDDEAHWVMLVPIDQIVGRLGDELAETLLRGAHSGSSDPRVIRRLDALVVQVVEKLRNNVSYRANDLLLDAIHSQLLGTATELLLDSDMNVDRVSPRKRFLACRRALRCAERLNRPINVDELAAQAGVSRRTLELGFRETLDISPKRYLRSLRLNGLHRDLRRAIPGRTTVTDAATHWGFVELGRIAVEYRQLFGESPSTTLARDNRIDCRRYADILTFSAGGTGPLAC